MIPVAIASGLFRYSVLGLNAANFAGGQSHYLGPGNSMPSLYDIERGRGRVPVGYSNDRHLQELDNAAFVHDVQYMKSQHYSPRRRNLRRSYYDLKMGADVFFTNPIVGGLMLAAGAFRYFQEYAMTDSLSRIFTPGMPWD
jgi:hypothetical protein